MKFRDLSDESQSKVINDVIKSKDYYDESEGYLEDVFVNIRTQIFENNEQFLESSYSEGGYGFNFFEDDNNKLIQDFLSNIYLSNTNMSDCGITKIDLDYDSLNDEYYVDVIGKDAYEEECIKDDIISWMKYCVKKINKEIENERYKFIYMKMMSDNTEYNEDGTIQ